MTPKISVVLPTYNRAHFLAQAIESALQQTFTDLELIIVDDGSTDESARVVAQFSDRRISYIYQANRGVAGACNRGAHTTQGEYVAFLGSDDQYLPRALATLLTAIESQPGAGLAAGGWRYIDGAGRALGEVHPWLDNPDLDVVTWLEGCPFGTGMVLIRRAWLEHVGGFDAELGCTEDCDLFLRLAYANCNMVYAREVVLLERVHEDNLSRNACAHRRAVLASLDKFYAQAGLPPELLAIKDHVYSVRHLRAAGQGYGAGQWEEARQDVAQAIALDSSILEGDGQLLGKILVQTAMSAMTTADPGIFLHQALEHLPEQADTVRSLRRKTWAELYTRQLFAAHLSQDWSTVRRAILGIVRHDPGRLFDRGIAAVGLEAICGPSLARRMKRLGKRLLRPKASLP